MSKVAVLELRVNSTLSSSDVSVGSNDQFPCTGSSGSSEREYWRVPSATDGRQSIKRTGRVAVLEELRAAGDVAERVGALDGLADDVEAVRRTHRATPGMPEIETLVPSQAVAGLLMN